MVSVSSQQQFRYTQPPSKVLHLRNLPWECAEEELIELGKPYGNVVNKKCNIGSNRNQDVSSPGIDQIRQAWESNRKSYSADFFQLDPSTENVEVHLEEKTNTADFVCCLQHLQLCFETEEKARRLLLNVSSLLKPGGYFLGITPDSSTIWDKYQKNVESYHSKGSGMKPNNFPNCIRTENYMITFEVEEEKFGPAKIVRPTQFIQPDKRRVIQALMTWNVTCLYSQFLAQKTPTCCVSLSAFYNETIVSCPTCACGCQSNSSQSGSCVNPNTPHLASVVAGSNGKNNLSPLVQCTSHMCPIQIHWHVKVNYKEYWRVKMIQQCCGE
ncbi:unnamed protein product [Trifolium pratense]|uniref:Uncharacterized protein n=1 Tax=Trifolium pratense TaxID=57577 RepID=A0ACB0LDN5_TRIPR|nr:unnamed protein product [Trifolium pratense]